MTTDRLWVEASNGHFGFSVQKKIWEECGSPMKYNNGYEKFMEKVGWRSGDDFVSYGYLKFSPSLSLRGELPVEENDGKVDGMFSFLASRLVNFNTTAFQPSNKNNL